MRIKIIYISGILFILSGIFFVNACFSEGENDITDWRKIETVYTDLFFRPEVNLKAVERQLRERAFTVIGIPKLDKSAGIEEKVAYRVDLIFKRAKQILDMEPMGMRVKIKIFKTRDELDKEYSLIFAEEAGYKSFYVFKFDTIYTSEEDISDSILAHEMAHSIVDHYFLVMPPPKIKEMLASYVDLHLDEEE